MKVSILTLGCKVNQAESAVIEGNLRYYGCSIVGLSECPDYCVVNTCTVTAKSDYQSRQLIRRAVKTGAKVIVTGCYSQLNHNEIENIDRNVDIIDNANKANIINNITNNYACNNLSYTSRARPHLKVQDGCNNSCTYCIVSKARGRSISTNITDIIEQVDNFISAGYKEIVLTGINLGSYGHDLNPKTKLSQLLRTILYRTKLNRIRLSSIEVKEVNDEIAELLQENRICKHVHIPLQSGDNRILSRMNRTYTAEEYGRIIDNLIKKSPGISIGTDVIVGFPGESNKEYLNTKRVLESLPITYMHIFPFSPRPNTIAFKMPMQITSSEKKERADGLNALNSAKKLAYMSAHIGKTLDIVVEGRGDDHATLGTSSNYLKVTIPSDGHKPKSLVYVRIACIEGNLLKGIPIDNL
jgi:threonylcarbamoyladenosine tRNA methylthiotransferase MtaB